jgi:hypothetical protein
MTAFAWRHQRIKFSWIPSMRSRFQSHALLRLFSSRRSFSRSTSDCANVPLFPQEALCRLQLCGLSERSITTLQSARAGARASCGLCCVVCRFSALITPNCASAARLIKRLHFRVLSLDKVASAARASAFIKRSSARTFGF